VQEKSKVFSWDLSYSQGALWRYCMFYFDFLMFSSLWHCCVCYYKIVMFSSLWCFCMCYSDVVMFSSLGCCCVCYYEALVFSPGIILWNDGMRLAREWRIHATSIWMIFCGMKHVGEVKITLCMKFLYWCLHISCSVGAHVRGLMSLVGWCIQYFWHYLGSYMKLYALR